MREKALWSEYPHCCATAAIGEQVLGDDRGGAGDVVGAAEAAQELGVKPE